MKIHICEEKTYGQVTDYLGRKHIWGEGDWKHEPFCSKKGYQGMWHTCDKKGKRK